MALPEANYVLLRKNDSFHAYFLWAADATATPISILPVYPSGTRLDEGHAALKEHRVALVGCGSLGSKIAVMLARAGVKEFLLIDDDIMLPDNLVRHDLDWREVASHKVQGVARRIRLVNPEAQCNARQYRLGGQQSSGSLETLIEMISKYDLIVDATADPKVFNYLCAAVELGKRPMIWAEIFGGGIGGLIARHRPGTEPAPATIRAQIEQWCREQGRPIERPAGGYDTEIDGLPMIADDADVSVIASHAARLAIDTAIPRDPSIFPHSVYLIGLSKGWIFDQPFETHPIKLTIPDGQPIQPVDAQLVQDELGRALQLFKNFSNEADRDPTNAPPAAG
jgi:molybdopterin/thiamine biosynthesis adenylyltransferase